MRLAAPRDEDLGINFFPCDDVLVVKSLNSTEDELWRKLALLTNKFKANEFLYSCLGNRKTIPKTSPALIEFIKQAYAFYETAEGCSPKVSPLFYYYSMLNLVKAYILSHKPSLVFSSRISKKHLSHGISAGEKQKKEFNFHKEVVEIKNEGILSSYLQLLLNRKTQNIPSADKSILVKSLLGYCIDVSMEFEQVFKKTRSTIPAELSIHKKANTGWCKVILYKNSFKDKRVSYKSIFHRNPSLNSYRRVKSFNNEIIVLESQTTFTSSNATNIGKKGNRAIAGLFPYPTFNIGDKGQEFYHIPLIDKEQSGLKFLLPEHIIIYMTMFYLGSLVRYQPYVLPGLYDSQEGWVLDAFIKTCPKKFLRYMVMEIFNQELIVNKI